MCDVIEQFLHILEADDGYHLPLLKEISASGNSLIGYEEGFRKLEERLRTPINKWRRLEHPLVWPLREKDLVKDLEAVHRMKGVLEFSLLADTAFSIVEIRKNTEDLKQTIIDSQSDKISTKQERLQERLQTILEWLDAPIRLPDITSFAENAPKIRALGC